MVCITVRQQRVGSGGFAFVSHHWTLGFSIQLDVLRFLERAGEQDALNLCPRYRRAGRDLEFGQDEEWDWRVHAVRGGGKGFLVPPRALPL